MSILDRYNLEGDLRVQIERDKTMQTGDWWELPDAVREQAVLAVSAEGAGKPYAYAEWLTVAVMALKRAHHLCEEGKVPDKGRWNG